MMADIEQLPIFKISESAPAFPTNSSKLNYIIPKSKLSRSKYRIFVRGPALWNEFLTDSEKEIENLSLFKSKLKSKLLSYENEVITFMCILISPSTSDNTQKHKNVANTHNKDKKVR